MKLPLLFLSCLVATLLASALFVQADVPFLGSIPVQYVNPGEELVLDMHRFYKPENPNEPRLSVATSDAYTARFDPDKFQLHVRPRTAAPGLLAVPIAAPGSQQYQAPRDEVTLVVRPRSRHEFRLQPAGEPKAVSVVGDFNGWDPAATPLTRNEQGVYSAEVPLSGGKLGYDFVVDGTWLTDPANPQTEKDEKHGEHSTYEHMPEAVYQASSLYADTLDKSQLQAWTLVFRVVDGGKPTAKASVVLEADGQTQALETKVNNGQVFVTLPPGVRGFVRAVVADEAGIVSNVVRVPVGDDKAFRWQDAVMYYALTDRFADGNAANDKPVQNSDVEWPANYHGGDLRGIRQKIESGYFEQMGVNTVWIAPLNRNPDTAFREFPEPHRWYTGYHGYWPVSATEIDPHFGTPEELKALVKTAHAHGIRILADLVLHHVHEQHPWWKEHPDWFGSLTLPDGRQNLRLWDEQQFTTWFEPFLPSFDFAKDAPTQALIDNTVWWAKEYDLDGFRLDAVKHILPRFWYRFRAALRERVDSLPGRTAPLYLVGETFKDREGISEFIGPNMLDGQFDFPLYDVIKDAFALGKSDLRTLEAAQRASERVYGKEALMSPLIGNHDKARFLGYADGDVPGDIDGPTESKLGWENPPAVDHPESYRKLALAQAYLMSLDGVPMLYYGDEVGMTGAGDPDNRRDMTEGAKVPEAGRQTLENFRKLGAMRAAHPALRYGSRRVLRAEGDVDAFVRAHLGDRVLAVFNRGAEKTSLTLEVAPEFKDGEYAEVLSGGKLKVEGGKVRCEVPAQTALFMVSATSLN